MKKKYNINNLAKAIGIPLKDWPGNCHAIAFALVKGRHVKGTVTRGLWHGPIAAGTMFSGRPFTGHSWIRCGSAIVDPTRYVFEGVAPYIYVGNNKEGYYDIGGNKLREALTEMRPAPKYDAKQKQYLVPIGNVGKTVIAVAKGGKEVLCAEQVAYIANRPPSDFGPYAKAVYKWLDLIGCSSYVPIDNWEYIMEG